LLKFIFLYLENAALAELQHLQLERSILAGEREPDDVVYFLPQLLRCSIKSVRDRMTLKGGKGCRNTQQGSDNSCVLQESVSSDISYPD
jgi:hypothetical protein